MWGKEWVCFDNLGANASLNGGFDFRFRTCGDAVISDISLLRNVFSHAALTLS